MPFRRKEGKKKVCRGQECDKICDNLTEQLLVLKNTFTQVLNSVCHAIEKDCGDVSRDEKAKELAKIKQKYSNLKEEISRIISEFTLTSPVSKEENAAVQEGLNQCMSYLNRVHNSMESILKKYEESDKNRRSCANNNNNLYINKCCEKESPHFHQTIEGNHIIIELKRGTQSEMDYVRRLLNNVNRLPEEKRKKIINKMCQLPKSEEELGAGDDTRRHINSIESRSPPCSSFFKSSAQKHSSIADLDINESLPQSNIQQKQEICQNWYFPEKIMESLLAGYSWSNDVKIELNEYDDDHNNNKYNKSKIVKTERPKIINEQKKLEVRCYGNNKEFRKNREEVISRLKIYDSKGNPLTNFQGVPLKTIKGDLLVKFRNEKPISTLNGEPVFDENSLPFVENLAKPLFNVNSEPLQIYNQEGIPLTDENGYVLKLINGKYAVHLDEYNRLVSDAYGRPLCNSEGNVITNLSAEHPYQQSSNLEPTVTCIQPLLYNKKGFLLTNSDGIPLTDSNGNPMIKKDVISGELLDSKGEPVYDSEGNIYFGNICEQKLALYDGNKYPLTGEDGTVLINVEGKEMVVFDKKGKPVKDCMNRLIYDANGWPSNNPKFNPYLHNPKSFTPRLLNVGIQLYDYRGYPLLDIDGAPLATSDGQALLVCNEKGEVCHDLNGYPVFDKVGIPLNKINDCWTTPYEQPYKVFNRNGFPLTSERGEDLFDINGHKLLELDHLGRPTLTAYGVLVCDANGYPASHPEFSPTRKLPDSVITRKVYMNNQPMKIYNQNGLPLTDTAGVAMMDANGCDLIKYNEHGIPIADSFGNKIFDEFRIPLDCQKDEPIISMAGKPFRIFDKQGRPLTDLNGIPLNLANSMCTIKFDNAGRPLQDFRNSDLYDFNGRTLQDPQTNPEAFKDKNQTKLVNRDGKPIIIFNKEGMPLTDKNGTVLMNSDGTHLCFNGDKFPVSDFNGDPVYDKTGQPIIQNITALMGKEEGCTDPFGRPLKDACGEAQFDKFGRPLYDLFRRPIYDEDGRPLSNAFGRYLVNNLPEPKDVDLGFDPIILNSRENSGNETITDIIGGPLFDCLGIPLYNQFGKPLIDIYGRPLYDDNGLPLCDLTGKPVSELVRQNGVPLQVKDVYKPIEVTKEVADLIDSTVIRSIRTEHSPHIPGVWILPTDLDKRDRLNHTPPEKKMYWALLRMTTFDDGKKSFEILEAKPYNTGSN